MQGSNLTSKMNNPYVNSLDGLKLSDPVTAFFDYCREREKIRISREKKDPSPWTNDIIFQKGRFLNVFREDDRVSKSIIYFAKGLEKDLPKLIQALFFARWCNKQEIIDKLSSKILLQPKKLIKELDLFNSWCNESAYPVQSIKWSGIEYSRIDSAVELFGIIKNDLTKIIIESEGDVIKATNSVNSHFKMENSFPIFMAIVDIGWFRPDIINPNSHVPTGIGAVAYLDRLQKYLKLKNHQETCDKMIQLQKKYWPEAKRTFQPIDIEYQSCECRKYYSYVNGTKLFEGKNLFRPKMK